MKRMKNRDPAVDETLFASNHENSVSRLQSEREKGAAERRGMPGAAESNNVQVVLSRAQLEAIKARSVIVTSQEKEEARRQEKEERESRMAKAQARKERMRQLELESRSKTTLTAEEEEDEQKASVLLNKAAEHQINQLDQVKNMRRKMMYAQCAKIREAQIEEKRVRESEEKIFNERQDILMEIDRLKSLQRQEQTRKAREQAEREDAKKIRFQIEERQRQRLVEEELELQEGEQMKEMIKREEEEARKKRIAHGIASKKLLEDVLAANDNAIQAKVNRRLEEKEEDDRILEWQNEMRRKAEELEAEKERIKAQKDKEFFAVAAQMKRSMDNRGAEDQLRAKRNQQEQERRERAAERALKEKQRKSLEELKAAREEQQIRKIENLKRLALADKAEFAKIDRENKEVEKRLDEIARKQQEMNDLHQKELREQMKKREEEARQRKMESIETAEKIKRENQRFLSMVEKKKHDILAEMEESGIPEKFRAEVARMKVTL